MSDTISVGSTASGGGNAASSLLVEEIGHLPFADFVPKRLAMLNYTLAAMSDDGRLMLGELRTRGGDDWALAGRSVSTLAGRAAAPSEERRYLDLAVVPNVQRGQGGAAVVFLVEKKNKERALTAHSIRHAKTLTLEDEFTSYDKVNMLGKGVTHIAADPGAPEPTVYSISSLVRKLRLEDGGMNLRPTAARAQVPTEAQDGTLAMAVQAQSAKQQQQTATVVVAFKTKSASKNKFMIEWFHSRKDEIACAKAAVKLGEDCEPLALLADPKDSRSVFVVCKNRTANVSALYKVTKGRKLEEPLLVFGFDVELATIGLSAEQVVTLVAYDATRNAARLYSVQKSDGFRGRHPACANCSSLEAMDAHSHVVACAVSKWQLSSSVVDRTLIGHSAVQMALVTLTEGARIASEPESGQPFRLRVIGCTAQGIGAVAITLDDLERTFDGAEDKLVPAVLKICLSHAPCRDTLSLLSAWLMAGRIAAVEVSFVKASDTNLPSSDSDRLVLKPIAPERFRSLVTDTDWTQQLSAPAAALQKQGTFTLDQVEQPSRPTSNGVESMPCSPRTHDLLRQVTATMSLVLDTDRALKSNLTSLQSAVVNLQESISAQKQETSEE